MTKKRVLNRKFPLEYPIKSPERTVNWNNDVYEEILPSRLEMSNE